MGTQAGERIFLHAAVCGVRSPYPRAVNSLGTNTSCKAGRSLRQTETQSHRLHSITFYDITGIISAGEGSDIAYRWPRWPRRPVWSTLTLQHEFPNNNKHYYVNMMKVKHVNGFEKTNIYLVQIEHLKQFKRQNMTYIRALGALRSSSTSKSLWPLQKTALLYYLLVLKEYILSQTLEF